MRLVHISDLHLGYRQFQRLTPTGVNQREADVAGTFRIAIDRIIALSPDVVIVAGDVFHSSRPTNQAILHAFLQFSRLVQALPRGDVVIVAGNHDSPRSSEVGGILPLLAQIGVHVVDRDAKRLTLANGALSVLAVPDLPGLVRPSLTPDGDAKYNVLAAHLEIQGMLPPSVAAADPAAVSIPREELDTTRFDYVALGHYHVYRELAPNAFYCGSIDYTSVNPWGELKEERDAKIAGKGFVERNLETGEHTFHALPASRPLVDLAPINAKELTAAEIDERMRSLIESVKGGIDDKIVRVRVFDAPRHIARELDHRAIREYKRRALNFHLDVRRPDVLRLHGSGAPGGRTMELKDIVAEKLRWRALDAGIDRDVLITRALAYLDDAQAAAPAPPPLVEA
jgi:DNA repair protein SbcD/Mre11